MADVSITTCRCDVDIIKASIDLSILKVDLRLNSVPSRFVGLSCSRSQALTSVLFRFLLSCCFPQHTAFAGTVLANAAALNAHSYDITLRKL